MDKRIKKQIAIALTGILTSAALLNSKPTYAENNGDIPLKEEVLPEVLENDVESKNSLRKGKVTVSSLNVRKGPSSNDLKIGSLKKNEIIEIESTSNGWHKIKYRNGIAYVTEQYISIIDDSNNGGPNNGGSQQEPVIKTGKVNTSTLNVRNSASASGAKLGTVSKGTTVEIVKEESNGWYRIKYKNGFGYVSAQYITVENTGGGGTTTPEPVIKTGTVNTSTLNVRSSASANGAKLGTVSRGTTVDIVKVESNGWYKIKYKNGYGYVSAQYITDQNTGGGSGGGTSDRVFQNPAGYIQFKDKISVGGAGKNLVKGTMGLRVAKVQRKLGMGQVWETVGAQTMSKVKNFQQRNGLKATGVVDLATWKKLGFSESEWYSMDAYVTPVRTNRNSTRQDIIEQMIRTAESYLGTEYVVGAAGVPGSGIDCSGLVMQAMYSVGIDPAPVSVTRHTQPGYEYESRNLWNLPTLKTVSTPQRGDLVFYKNSLGTIIHVAIYLGNNQVIESWPEKVVKWPLIHPERPLIKGYKRVIG